MARRKTHRAVGIVSGAGTALILTAQDANFFTGLMRTIAGGCGGAIGSWVADIIDWPDSPRHRSIAHSVTINGSLYLKLKKHFKYCIAWLEKKAAELLEAGKAFLSCLCEMLAAFLIGLVAGHVSHLVVDACKGEGLPLIARMPGRKRSGGKRGR